ncbi:hypothetical protein [Gordonia hankookensis]|uniref:Uncharacterized protein n=1 Tax=Gordonia hankookensis TaxID=589403 RepID=A0ABR7W6M8_9ACTN|nr:hypothetical protein [Gordonia hankookensis]MBD1318136.1 hypothetical protein [Gordonia hankookensis]
MYIDCQSCPGRPVACDGCMMQVLFDAPNCENPTVEGGGKVTRSGVPGDADIDAAIGVFEAAAMVSSAAAVSARNGKTADGGMVSGRQLRILRAG